MVSESNPNGIGKILAELEMFISEISDEVDNEAAKLLNDKGVGE
jgi:hypothetical protein